MKSSMTLRLGASYHDREETFSVPEGWRLRVCPPAGRPALGANELARAFAEPVGSRPIRERAKGAKSAAILVDDFRRPTPAEPLCLAVVAELKEAGVPREEIRVFLGNGAHRVMSEAEARQRLGRAYDEVGEVVSHDAFSPDMAFLGITSFHTPILVNRQAAEADFSVSISTVYPHTLTAWGGGAKMVLPGITHVSTSRFHHTCHPRAEWGGDPDLNPARRDLEEAAALFGLDVSVCCVVGTAKELCGLAVGDPTLAHRQAVAWARAAYATDLGPVRPDLVIANAYPMDGDPTQLGKTEIPCRRGGAPILIVIDFADPCPWHGVYDGPREPYLRRDQPAVPVPTPELLAKADTFVYCPQFGNGYIPTNRNWYCENDWDRLMAAMAQRFPAANVTVLPAAPLQIPTVS